MMASKIFTGYRALGFVSTHVPLAVRYHNKHKENYVVTSAGRAFQVYNVSSVMLIPLFRKQVRLYNNVILCSLRVCQRKRDVIMVAELNRSGNGDKYPLGSCSVTKVVEGVV